MRDRQKEIIDVFNNDPALILSKQQIIAGAQIAYWSSTNKHVGDRLTRLVKSKKLVRVKHNQYRLYSYKDNSNQLDLF